MLRLLLVATLCVATLAAPRPNGKPGRDRGQPRPGRVLPGSIPGMNKQPIGMPRTLPSMMTQQLDDLFQRMQLQQDSNQLDLAQWQNRVQESVDGWWAAISQRMSMTGRDHTFPDEIATAMTQKVTEAFTQMQNEVNSGNVLSLDHWLGVLKGDASDSWTQFVDGTVPNQPGYSVVKPRGNKPSKGDKPGRGNRPGPDRGQRPSGGRGDRGQQGRPGSHSPPADLPQEWKQQLDDIFVGMQQEVDAGRDLTISDWHGETKEAVNNWWTRIKSRLEADNISPPGRQQTFPDEVHPRMQENILSVFDGIKEETIAGRDPDMEYWGNEMGEHAETWWDKVMGLFTDGNQPSPGRGQGSRGHGPRGQGIPDNMPPKMQQALREVFEGLKQEIEESGNQLDIEVWRNKTLELVNDWWGRMSNIPEHKNPKAAEKPFFDEIPTRWLEQVNDLYNRMQLQLDNGEPLDVTSWYEELRKGAERWWDAFARRAEGLPGRPFEPRKNFSAEMPDAMADTVHDVFNRIQEHIDNQTTVQLMPYHDEIQKIAEKWFDRFTKHMSGGRRGQDMPIEMSAQITDVFTRMREAGNMGQWDVDVWRNESLQMAQGWWEKFTTKITDSDLAMIPTQWITDLQEIFEAVENTDPIDINQWREDVLNQSASWLEFDQSTLKRLGFKVREDIKMLDKLGSRIPQHINHIFDRMQVKSLDGLPLNITEWQQELEDLAMGWGKRILSFKERMEQHGGKPGDKPGRPGDKPGRPQGRPDRPQGRPQGRPDRPQGRPQGRPDKPQGRPQGRPDRPQGRPDRPQGRPDGPQGRPLDSRPQRPGKPQDRPGRPNGRPDRPDGRPGKPQDRPQKPQRGGGRINI